MVGRIDELSGKRWKVNLNSMQEAALHLSAVNLPGGVQRRRTWEDELNMRNVYTEGDYISAEVQSVHTDGSVALHTRSSKYGKLEGGQIVTVPAYLVKKQKQNFMQIDATGVTVILGCNGFIWIGGSESIEQIDDDHDESEADRAVLDNADLKKILIQRIPQICRVSNLIRCLGRLHFTITKESILKSLAVLDKLNMPARDINDTDSMLLITELLLTNSMECD